jgi:prolyl-tRNA synthetase
MAAQTNITPRSKDYSQWYQDVIACAELAEPANVVKGCMVIRPHGYAIWEKIQADLDRRFKETGHKNAYFPLLIPLSFLAKEAQHVQGFAMECAVVTHSGLRAVDGKLEVRNELEEPYVVRPTSETIIGHFFSKWIDSYRDLPLLINQWANIMRWEMRTRLFLRTTEFLWQEGHTAHATHEDSRAEVLRMLDVYRDFAHEVAAVPVIRGVKTANERFAGAIETRCIEAFMQDGKALQAGTSHDLGQNFGKAFDIKFQNQAGEREHVWQTSWGVSTRLVGALIMAHSDDEGLVLPPKLAPIHVAIVPIWRKPEEQARVLEVAERVANELRADGLEVVLDAREDARPGEKYYHWERRGVPIRIELGPRDIEAGSAMIKLRVVPDGTDPKAAKKTIPLADIGVSIGKELDAFQSFLFERARKRMHDSIVKVDSWAEFEKAFADQGSRFVLAHWDGTTETELAIKEATKATIRCLPYPEDVPGFDPREAGRCVKSGKPSAQRVLFAKNY